MRRAASSVRPSSSAPRRSAAKGSIAAKAISKPKRGGRRADRALFRQRATVSSVAVSSKRGDEPKADADGGLDPVQRIVGLRRAVRSASAMASRCARSRPAMASSVWPATRSMARARSASIAWARRRAGLQCHPAGDKRNAEAGDNEPEANQNTEQRLHETQRDAVAQSRTAGRRRPARSTRR